MIKPFIPKDHPDLPDSYKVTIIFLNGQKMEKELAGHRIADTVFIPSGQTDKNGKPIGQLVASHVPFLEYQTKDDFWGWIPMSSIQDLQFDKNFSKIMALKEEKSKEKK